MPVIQATRAPSRGPTAPLRCAPHGLGAYALTFGVTCDSFVSSKLVSKNSLHPSDMPRAPLSAATHSLGTTALVRHLFGLPDRRLYHLHGTLRVMLAEDLFSIGNVLAFVNATGLAMSI
jgi:hypothetical protein